MKLGETFAAPSSTNSKKGARQESSLDSVMLPFYIRKFFLKRSGNSGIINNSNYFSTN